MNSFKKTGWQELKTWTQRLVNEYINKELWIRTPLAKHIQLINLHCYDKKLFIHRFTFMVIYYSSLSMYVCHVNKKNGRPAWSSIITFKFSIKGSFRLWNREKPENIKAFEKRDTPDLPSHQDWYSVQDYSHKILKVCTRHIRRASVILQV